jgi:hypothetical protein
MQQQQALNNGTANSCGKSILSHFQLSRPSWPPSQWFFDVAGAGAGNNYCAPAQALLVAPASHPTGVLRHGPAQAPQDMA